MTTAWWNGATRITGILGGGRFLYFGGGFHYAQTFSFTFKSLPRILNSLSEFAPVLANNNKLGLPLIAVSYTHLDVYKRQLFTSLSPYVNLLNK